MAGTLDIFAWIYFSCRVRQQFRSENLEYWKKYKNWAWNSLESGFNSFLINNQEKHYYFLFRLVFRLVNACSRMLRMLKEISRWVRGVVAPAMIIKWERSNFVEFGKLWRLIHGGATASFIARKCEDALKSIISITLFPSFTPSSHKKKTQSLARYICSFFSTSILYT